MTTKCLEKAFRVDTLRNLADGARKIRNEDGSYILKTV